MSSPSLIFVVFVSLKNKEEVNTNIGRETITKYYFHHSSKREEKPRNLGKYQGVGI